jgi:uncharacterized membrane protein YdjX (TVP38/TMEM64 family)
MATRSADSQRQAAHRPAPPRRPARRRRLGLLVILGLVLAALVVWVVTSGVQLPRVPGFELSAAEVEALIESFGVWGVLASILIMVLHSFVPFPAKFAAMANGMLYGPIWGTLITWTGAMLGAWLAFGLARWLGRPFVLRMVGERRRAAVDEWALRQGAGALLFSRLVPVISFNLINYAAGLTPISWWTFTWATGLGILPLTALMVLMGDGIWSGGSLVWLWLIGAALIGWSIWWLVARRRASRP